MPGKSIFLFLFKINFIFFCLGLRHIRGILFDDSSEDYLEQQLDDATVSSEGGKIDEDFYPLECAKCGLRKSSVRAIKMHILLAHLKSGKFRCTRCEVSVD